MGAFPAVPARRGVRVQALNNGGYNGQTRVTRANLFQRLWPNGQYTDDVEGDPNGRPDGYHLSDGAAANLARNWRGPIVRSAASKQPGGGILGADSPRR